MIVLCEALFLAVMFVVTVFAGSKAWSGEVIPPIIIPRVGVAIEDRSITIVIRPAVNLEATDATSAAGDLTLAEIVDPATIGSEDREPVMRHLKAVVLTDRPKIGEERTFTQEGLESIVGEASRRLEAAGYTIDWKIPRRSHILRKNTFSREAVTKQLQNEFALKCGGCDAIISRIDFPRTEGMKIKSWHLVMRAEKPRGSFAVPIEFELEDSGAKKTLMLSGQVEFFAQVPVATRAIQGSEKFATTDFRVERRNVTYSLDAAADIKDFENSVAARGLSVGEPIWKGSIRREQLIRFGDPVRVQVGGDTWSVTSDGIAQGPAALGEMVRVKVGKNQKLVSGILKEKGLVEVQ